MNRAGFLFGMAAYTWWGLVPLYFKAVKQVPAPEMLAHRVVWSVLLLGAVLFAVRRWAEVGRCLRVPSLRWPLVATTILIAINWGVYIYSVISDRLVESSLGYFLLPLASILMGLLLLGERLNGLQGLAVLLGAAGVAMEVLYGGGLPWIALTLAGSFSLYGLIRKRLAIDGVTALTVETLLLLPVALAYLAWLSANDEGAMTSSDPSLAALIVLSGVITTVPLFCFGEAARRLPLTALGFLQYLSPSLALLLAVYRYDEPFDEVRLVHFAFIWVGLLLFTWATVRASSRRIEPVEIV